MSLLQNTMAKSGTVENFYNGVATQSLRFDDVSNSKLTRAQTTTGNQKLWTSSFWVKRSDIDREQQLWSGGSYDGNNGIAAIYFSSANKITTYFDTSGANPVGAVNNRLYRDTSAWYHIVWAVDAVNTVQKIWVNGVEESLSSSLNPPNYAYGMNRSGVDQAFGGAAWGGSPNLSGYLAEITHLDGQYLDETSFGEFKNGVWIAKDTSDLTFGTNGFRLKFDQVGVGTASTSTIGADTSGNTNHFTSSGIVASDCAMPDSPENNFCTWNPLSKSSGITLSEGNLKTGAATENINPVKGTMALPLTGKWYWEIRLVSLGYLDQIGIADDFKGMVNSADGSAEGRFWGFGTWFNTYNSSVSKYQVNVASSGGTNWTGVAAPSAGDILMVAYDADNGTLWFGKNDSWYNTSGTANPATNTDPRFSSLTGHEWFAWFAGNGHNSASTYIANFGQDGSFAGALTGTAVGDETDGNGFGLFKYAPPSGFLSLCSANLPEPTIGANSTTQADDHFKALPYISDNIGANGTQNVTGVGFKPDWVWLKNRTSGSTSHTLYDAIRGTGRHLSVNSAAIEVGLNSEYGYLGTFGNDGYTLRGGSTNANYVNQSTDAYVSWNWKAGGTPTADNSEAAGATPTAGSVKIDGVNLGSALAGTTAATRLTANTTAGFSIIKYAGNSASKTVAHGLNSAPTFVIAKSLTDAERWVVFHNSISTKYIYLNETFAGATGNADERFGNSTSVVVPNDTVVTMGASNSDINENGDNYIMYAFHEVEGYSKFGKYAGGGSGGEFVYLGFRPAFVIFKVDAASTQWLIFDSARATYNLIDDVVLSHTDQAEGFSSGMELDFLSNGFKIRGSNNDISYASQTHIYMAFAEAPFKYANAR